MTNTKAPLPVQHMILTMGIRDNVKQLSKKGGAEGKPYGTPRYRLSLSVPQPCEGKVPLEIPDLQ